MRDDQDEALWNLLGKAERPIVSAFFSRNVMREVRNLKPADNRRIWQKWLLPSAACVALFSAAIFMTQGAGPTLAHRAASDDFEMIALLDQMLASEMNDAWAEVSLF